MQILLATLIPGFLLQTTLLGPGYMLNLFAAVLAGFATEVCACWMRQGFSGSSGAQLLQRATGDASVWVTTVLIVLALPPNIPVGILIFAVVSGLTIGKHAYGGLGQNIFNPAMVGYAIVLVSFPAALSIWPGSIATAASEGASTLASVDGLSGATVLESFKHRSGITVQEFWQEGHRFGLFGSRNWEWVNLAYLCGGLVLVWRGIVPWRLPLSFLLTLVLLSALGYDTGSSESLGSPALHLFSGGTMLFAFYVLTDPVTCPSSARGQILFASLIAVTAFVIRAFGAFPDGLAFAVLLGNLCTPLIDRMDLKPRKQVGT